VNMQIRPEQQVDHSFILELTKRAFAPMPFAAGDEQELIGKLRQASALSLSLVAERNGRIVGHVALSPVEHDSGIEGWYGLGPISVEPEMQRIGIGTALIALAKVWLRTQNARGCILVGDPAYYPRHGFQPAPAHAPATEPAQFFMVLALDGDIPAGRFRYHPLFHEG
jgi:putative acetyltransferase